MRKIKALVLVPVLFVALFITGCKADYDSIFQSQEVPVNNLIKVQIFFTDDKSLVGYVKSLGVEENGKVYVGGSSLNHLYDKDGNIIGSYNYQRVLYIMILPEEKGED